MTPNIYSHRNERDGSDTEPRGFGLVLLWAVFGVVAVLAVAGAWFLAAVNGCQRARTWAGRRWDRVWFWLTYSVDCAWCRKRQHQAWIPLRKISRDFPLPRVSHGCCAMCYEEFIRGVPTEGSAPIQIQGAGLALGSAEFSNHGALPGGNHGWGTAEQKGTKETKKSRNFNHG